MMALQKILRGNLKQGESLARYTSWRVGGEAKQLYRPVDLADLANFLQQLPADEPVLWLGLGSNLLVRDGGFDGTVIATVGALQNIDIEDRKVEAEVGIYCGKLARHVARAGLKGGAWLAGIPGTLGGALAMNAGAHGDETWDYVSSVTTINKLGELRQRPRTDFEVQYRHVSWPEGEWFISATMQFEQGNPQVETNLIRELLKKRNVSQPTNQPCAGSVFRNPEGDFAGRLIENSELKGLKVGGASVSTKHANFIVNDGTASAADIEKLIELVQQRVEQLQGVRLVPEVHIIGEFAA